MTARGFPDPEHVVERMKHEEGDRFYVVRMTRYERTHLQLGVGISGKFALMKNPDGTYEFVRYAEGVGS